MTENTPPAVAIRPALRTDRRAIVELLQDAGLPFDDIAEALPGFFVAVAGERLAGAVGIEIFGSEAFLRSLAVAASFRGRGIGRRLTEKALRSAREKRAKTLYLLTNSAEDFFSGRGFTTAPRTEAPATIRRHRQFTALCPESATLMRIEL